jgi:guanylate kinase
VKGAQNLKKYFGDDALAIFVKVPSLEVLKERLTGRGTESAASLSQRFYRAEFEMTFENKFDVTLVNEKLDQSYEKAELLINDFLKK